VHRINNLGIISSSNIALSQASFGPHLKSYFVLQGGGGSGGGGEGGGSGIPQ
jgi:hypothetical protein